MDCEGSEGRNKSTLSDAVIRKLKLKNQQLDKELRDKKRHLEEMTKSVMSWKKNIKDRHVAKIEQVMRDPPTRTPWTLHPVPEPYAEHYALYAAPHLHVESLHPTKATLHPNPKPQPYTSVLQRMSARQRYGQVEAGP